jgi:hypothetical protein
MVNKEFLRGNETRLSSRSRRTYRIGFILLFIFAAVVMNTLWNKTNKAEHDFLKGSTLDLTLKVLEIKPTGNHGYGVIYGRVIKSNKSSLYSAIYDNRYAFCKI